MTKEQELEKVARHLRYRIRYLEDVAKERIDSDKIHRVQIKNMNRWVEISDSKRISTESDSKKLKNKITVLEEINKEQRILIQSLEKALKNKDSIINGVERILKRNKK